MPGRHVPFFQIHAPYGIEGGWEKRGPEVEDVFFGAAPEDGEMIRGSVTPIGRDGIDPDRRARANGLLNIYLTSLNPRIRLLSQLVEGREG